jgi:hypothetical protein
MNTNDKTYLYYLKVTIPPMVVFVLLAIVVWQYRLSVLNDRQQKEVSAVIHNVVQEQAKKNLLLPQIVFINADSSKKKELNEKMIEQISSALTKKYLSNDTTKFSDIELKPYFVLPTTKNKNGSYNLTEAQLTELSQHIDFLTKQVDLAVNSSKDEIANDINRLNTWMTLWIGIIGFLGIFIPIIINIDTSKSAEKATEKSDLASKNADIAIAALGKVQTEVGKIPDIEQKIKDAEKSLGEIKTKSDTAEMKSDAADLKANDAAGKAKNALEQSVKTESVLTAINAIGNLKDIDINTLQYITKPMSVVIKTLTSVHSGLTNCINQTDHPVVKDCLRQLGVRLQILTFFKFMKHDNTELINNFAGVVSDKLNNNYSKQNFEDILSELKILINNLKSD